MNAGRARYDVLRIMRGVSEEDDGRTSPLKSPRTGPLYDDILTSDDILKEKYQELGHLLAKQFVERNALSVLESSLLGQKKKRKPRARKKSFPRNRQRPSSAKSFASEDSSRWYDSDYTDYTETSGVSSGGKRVSFADNVSFSEESSVIITEITEDDAEFEELIKRKPRVTKEEEEAEAFELNEYKRHNIEKELIQSILRSPRPQSARNYKSPYGSRSTTPTSPRRRSSQRVPNDDEERSNNERKEHFRGEIVSFSSAEESDDDLQSSKQPHKKSPRKGKKKRTLNTSNNSPRKGLSSSPTRRKIKSKSPRKTKTKEKEEEDQIPPELQQSPRKELDPIDNQLANSKNKHLKAWLRQKDANIRRQKKEEQKKERTKREEEDRVRDERAQRLEESRERYNEWVNRKKRLDRSASKAFDQVHGSEHARPTTTGKAAPQTRRPISMRRPPPKEPPKTTHDNSIGIVRDYDGDWTESVNCKRDLAAERERDEEKRQAKEANKRERIRKAKLAAEKKNEPKSQKPKRSFPRANSPKKNIDSKEKAPPVQHQQKPKTKPSSNPLKGMTYDQWLNQKIKTEQTKKQDIHQDPDLEDLIPLLAKHRIEQATERSRRVDSGLNRSKSSATPVDKSSNNSKNKKAFDGDNDNGRPYTWKSDSENKSTKEKQWKSFPIGRNSYVHVKTPTPPQSPSKNSKIGTRKRKDEDILSSVRPEPQGCELPPSSHCQEIGKGSDQDGVFMTEAMCVK